MDFMVFIREYGLLLLPLLLINLTLIFIALKDLSKAAKKTPSKYLIYVEMNWLF